MKRDGDETNYGGSLAQSVEQRTFNPLVESSNLSQPTTGCLAQLGEHLPYKERVIGSIPIATTISSFPDLSPCFRNNRLVRLCCVVCNTFQGFSSVFQQSRFFRSDFRPQDYLFQPLKDYSGVWKSVHNPGCCHEKSFQETVFPVKADMVTFLITAVTAA